MDLQKLKPKLVGSDENRAVSPVIGVILMVAITVILAAVVAGVMTGMVGDMSNTNPQGAAQFSVDDDDDEITVEVTSLNNADSMELGGDISDEVSEDDITGLQVGDTVTLEHADDGGDFSSDSGTVTAVAVNNAEDGETDRNTVGSQDFDFSGGGS